MKISTHQKIGAVFQLIAYKDDGTVSKKTEQFKNLVLDAGLQQMSVDTWIDRCCVGTGNSTPNVKQLDLDAFVASTRTMKTTVTKMQTTNEPYYYSVTVTWRFERGVAAGNLSEVGLGWADDKLWNRALIKDANGNPTTITVLADEYLDVVSEIRIYPPRKTTGKFNLFDKTGKLVSQHTTTCIPLFHTTAFGASRVAMGFDRKIAFWIISSDALSDDVTSIPTGGSVAAQVGSSVLTYPTQTSCRMTATLDLDKANGSHRSFVIPNTIMSMFNGYKVQIDPPITKTSSQVMTYVFDLSWGRYETS